MERIDFDEIVGFHWDEGNAWKSVDRHGVSRAETEEAFLNEPLLIVEDIGHSQSELRFHALGVTNVKRRLHITFTLREGNSKIRVISARDMSRKERDHYEQET